MRFTLPESSARRQRSTAGTLASVALHAALIGGTLVATGISAERPVRVTPPPEELVFLHPRPKDDRPPRSRTVVPDRPTPRGTQRPVPTQYDVPALAVDPLLVPTVIPDVASKLGQVQAPGVFGRAVESAAGTSGGAGPQGDSTGPMTDRTVDRAVVPRAVVTPRYPSLLLSAGVEGTVLVEFVVDTSGRVEPESLVMLRSDHRFFEQSVRDVLLRMRFVPAEARGRRVRQLVQQQFTFALERE